MQDADVQSRTAVPAEGVTVVETRSARPARQAYEILHWGYVVLPLIAGLDKFTNMLVRWPNYLSVQFANLSPFNAMITMKIVGVIEIAASLLVALIPRIGSYVVAGWLALIIVNLGFMGAAWDVALRDFGLLLGALALGRLASQFDRPGVKVAKVRS